MAFRTTIEKEAGSAAAARPRQPDQCPKPTQNHLWRLNMNRKDNNAMFKHHVKTGSLKQWDKNQTVILHPLRAIRGKCLDCSGYYASRVALCLAHQCPLYPYRFGRGIKTAEVDLQQNQSN